MSPKDPERVAAGELGDKKTAERYIPDECTHCGARPVCAWYKPSIGAFVAVCSVHRPAGVDSLPRFRVLD